MPELPEVEAIRRGVEPYLVGTSIIHVIIRDHRFRWTISDEIYKINNKMVLSVQRRAKYLLIELSEGWIIIHFGMSGRLSVLPKNTLANKHDHIDLVLNNNKLIRYSDPRRFGYWIWTEKIEEHIRLVSLGPEPLSKDFNSSYLREVCAKEKCKKRKLNIKSLLMNSKIVAGIGNIYANESLFIAKIKPDRLGSSLKERECEILVQSIKILLQSAIDYGGTTIKDFYQPNGNPGYFVCKLNVYGRQGKPCSSCKTPILIRRNDQSQRATFYCSNCQR